MNEWVSEREREKGKVLSRKKGTDGEWITLWKIKIIIKRVDFMCMWYHLMRCFAFKGTCGTHPHVMTQWEWVYLKILTWDFTDPPYFWLISKKPWTPKPHKFRFTRHLRFSYIPNFNGVDLFYFNPTHRIRVSHAIMIGFGTLNGH